MSDSMTIADASELKEMLEQRVAEMIVEFENKTDLMIVDITVKQNDDGTRNVIVSALL